MNQEFFNIEEDNLSLGPQPLKLYKQQNSMTSF